jgi:YtkA-like
MKPSILLTLAAASVLSCTSSSPASSDGTASLMSDQGKIKVLVRAVPLGPMNAGNDAVELTLTDPKTGKPIENEKIELVPFMPTMGHGTDVTPVIADMGKGVYSCTNVNLIMPGEWQLRFKFMSPVSDSAAPDFEVQ